VIRNILWLIGFALGYGIMWFLDAPTWGCALGAIIMGNWFVTPEKEFDKS
jgi:hypothetical protein